MLGHQHEGEDPRETPLADAGDRREDNLRDAVPKHDREPAVSREGQFVDMIGQVEVPDRLAVGTMHAQDRRGHWRPSRQWHPAVGVPLDELVEGGAEAAQTANATNGDIVVKKES